MRKDIIVSTLEPRIDELESIWEYIGYEIEERDAKLQNLADVLQKQLFEFISTENTYRIELLSQIESKNRKATMICQSLRLPAFFSPRDMPCLKLLSHVEEHIAKFEKEVNQRLQQYSQLKAKIISCCDKLDIKDISTVVQNIPWHEITPDSEYIPSEPDLDKLQEKSKELEETYNNLLSKFSTLRQDIFRIAAEIEYSPQSDFEKTVLDSASSPTTTVKLSQHSLEELQSWRLRLVKQKAMLVGTCDEIRAHIKVMWRRLGVSQTEQNSILVATEGYKPSILEALQEEDNRCQELKWSQMKVYVENLRSEVQELYELCFMDEQIEITDDSEESLNALEQTIDKLRESYENHRDVYDAVNQYQVLWKMYMDIEQKMKDPAILSNRGGILLKTDKEKKRLLKELPRMEAEVNAILVKMNAQDFRIQGRSFAELVQHLWDEFNREKEYVKYQRKVSKSFANDDSRPSTANSLSKSTASPRKTLESSGKHSDNRYT